MSEDTQTGTIIPASSSTVDEWWATPEADEVEGYDLIKDEALLQLVGVPFMAFRVVFRDGIQRKGAPYRDDYVSIELRIAPTPVFMGNISRIQGRRIAAKITPLTAMEANVLPGEQVVINDGSTGLYRQIVQYLAAKGYISLPEGDEEAEKGDSIYDLPRSQWLTGADEATKGIDIQLRCSRGLRFSDYQNEYTGDDTARTWYIA